MKTIQALIKVAVLALAAGWLTGCESSGGGSSVSGGGYYGVGIYDPWYYGGYYEDVDVIVTPPGDRPPVGAHPEQPIAWPLPAPAPQPTSRPSIPMAPRPMPRRR